MQSLCSKYLSAHEKIKKLKWEKIKTMRGSAKVKNRLSKGAKVKAKQTLTEFKLMEEKKVSHTIITKVLPVEFICFGKNKGGNKMKPNYNNRIKKHANS